MEKLKLNVQLFGETSFSETELKEIEKEIDDIVVEIKGSFDKINTVIKNLLTDEGFKSTAGESINNAMEKIAPYFGEFETSVSDLGKFISYVVSTFKVTDEEMKKEYESWAETITGVVSNIKSGFTEVSSGYTSSQYVADLSSSARNIVKETANMIANTGKLYSSATGKSVATSVKELGSAAVGTVKTLFGFITKNSSVASRWLGSTAK